MRIDGDVPPVGSCVHLHAAADGARDGAHELEAAQVGSAGAVEADGERRTAAGGEQAILRMRGRELAAELEHEALVALVGGEEIRSEPDRGDRKLLLARPGQHLHELVHGAWIPEPASGPTGAKGRVLRERHTFLKVHRSCSSMSGSAESTSPAPIVSTRSPGRANEATSAAAS